MAKGDIGYLERKTRDIPKADITVIVLIVVAFGVLILPGTVFSEYIITTEHGKVSAQTYWILRDRLYLKDNGNLTSVPLREMKSIEGGLLTIWKGISIKRPFPDFWSNSRI
ncbi:MAG: hypothetical protein U9P49_02270 [Thermodesulfobacteriota bacterium]|nr:hypothetical protein [Thermodesulfobacteriota bacterium]